ncbi:hypothetical protein ABIE44_000542 [Marmoricola sp. OAE513]|uniref:hypothetical protein n=1 Tax=Marmoricola sp. OAE513 TaxID=2817894 RepID=UPI001AE9B430
MLNLEHEQLTMPDGIEVDVGIAPLLRSLWELGLRTSYSCQGTSPPEPGGDGRESYISFPDAADGSRFFAETLEALSVPGRVAQIKVSVQFGSKPPRPGREYLKSGSPVVLELSLNPSVSERRLRGCVRFDPDLMPEIEAAFGREA